MVLHAREDVEKYEKTIVVSRDTDVFVLLKTFKDELSQEVLLQNSTYREPQYIPIHTINIGNILQSLLAFHAYSGSDCTDRKKTAWKVFLEYSQLLKGLGKPFKLWLISMMQRNLCAGCTISMIQSMMFGHQCFKSITNIDKLPPTNDALT